MNTDDLRTLGKSEIPAAAESLGKADIHFLIDALTEKEDAVRYNAFLLLQASSRLSPAVYEYWDTFEAKLESDNSYQRSLGLMLIAENARWDKTGKFSKTISPYLKCCTDEKFITARQAIQGLAHILEATDTYDQQLKRHLNQMSILKYKDNQQRLLSKDIGAILKQIETHQK